MTHQNKAILILVFLPLLGADAYLVFQLIPQDVRENQQLPAWVQAIGSVLAILVAVAVPYMQRLSDKKSTRATAEATAEVIAPSILIQISHTIGVLMTIQRLENEAVDKRLEVTDAKIVLKLLEAQPLPSKDELIALATVLPDCAKRLARALGEIEVTKSRLAMIDPDNGDFIPHGTPALWSVVTEPLNGAKNNLKDALNGLKGRYTSATKKSAAGATQSSDVG